MKKTKLQGESHVNGIYTLNAVQYLHGRLDVVLQQRSRFLRNREKNLTHIILTLDDG